MTIRQGRNRSFTLALKCYEDDTHPLQQVVVFFKAVTPSQLSDPGPQLKRVLDFKRELEGSKRILFHTVDELDAFTAQIRRYVVKWLRDHERGERSNEVGPSKTFVDKLPGAVAPAAKEPRQPDDLKDVLDEADRLADHGALTDAEAIYARCVTKYRAPDAFNRNGVFLLRNHRLAQAEVMFQEVEALADVNGVKWRSIASINRGLVYRIRLDLDTAEASYAKALDIDRQLGRDKESPQLSAASGRWPKSEEICRAPSSTSPRHWKLQNEVSG